MTLAFLETAQKTGYYYWAEAVGHEKLDETMANAYHAGHLPAQPQWVNSRIGA